MTCLRKHSLMLRVLAVLTCILAGTRANAQGDNLANLRAGQLANAAYDGDLHRVKVFLAAGYDVNAKAGNGGTALMAAAQEGHHEVVRALLAAQADVNGKVGDGTTALIRASSGGHQEVVRALLDAEADVNAKAGDGTTALIAASFVRSEE